MDSPSEVGRASRAGGSEGGGPKSKGNVSASGAGGSEAGGPKSKGNVSASGAGSSEARSPKSKGNVSASGAGSSEARSPKSKGNVSAVSKPGHFEQRLCLVLLETIHYSFGGGGQKPNQHILQEKHLRQRFRAVALVASAWPPQLSCPPSAPLDKWKDTHTHTYTLCINCMEFVEY